MGTYMGHGSHLTPPLITIAITCHNAADTIERAVGSALAQDWPNLEVVVVDDCSTDGSWATLKALMRGKECMRIVRHEANRGYPGALNTAIGAARGAFVAIFDDDDESLPERVRAQLARILDYEHEMGARIVFCYANRNVVKSGQSDHIARAIGRQPREPHGPAVADYVFLFSIAADPRFVWGSFGSCTLMARRESFVTIGPFDEGFRRCAEWDMAVRAAFLGAHFIAVDRPLIIQHKTQSGEKSGTMPLKFALQLDRKHRDFLRSRKIYFAARALAHSRFHGANGRLWRSRAYLVMALVLGPRLLGAFLRSRAHVRTAARATTVRLRQ
jgi:glycosyltransferase involved in cell wall biosynthesis